VAPLAAQIIRFDPLFSLARTQDICGRAATPISGFPQDLSRPIGFPLKYLSSSGCSSFLSNLPKFHQDLPCFIRINGSTTFWFFEKIYDAVVYRLRALFPGTEAVVSVGGPSPMKKHRISEVARVFVFAHENRANRARRLRRAIPTR
jgi:hypothetical protein